MRDTDLSQMVPPMKGVISNAPDRQEIAAIRKTLESTLTNQIEKKTVGIHETREGLVVSLREIGFFDSGSATLRPGAAATLKQIADVLRGLAGKHSNRRTHGQRAHSQRRVSVQLGAFHGAARPKSSSYSSRDTRSILPGCKPQAMRNTIRRLPTAASPAAR